jgi:hypothetical protein
MKVSENGKKIEDLNIHIESLSLLCFFSNQSMKFDIEKKNAFCLIFTKQKPIVEVRKQFLMKIFITK